MLFHVASCSGLRQRGNYTKDIKRFIMKELSAIMTLGITKKRKPKVEGC
jgi:hydroxylamine reductase (hybrid-cluster protein)